MEKVILRKSDLGVPPYRVASPLLRNADTGEPYINRDGDPRQYSNPREILPALEVLCDVSDYGNVRDILLLDNKGGIILNPSSKPDQSLLRQIDTVGIENVIIEP